MSVFDHNNIGNEPCGKEPRQRKNKPRQSGNEPGVNGKATNKIGNEPCVNESRRIGNEPGRSGNEPGLIGNEPFDHQTRNGRGKRQKANETQQCMQIISDGTRHNQPMKPTIMQQWGGGKTANKPHNLFSGARFDWRQ